MFGKHLRKAVAVVGLLALLTGLFGCEKSPKPARHELSQISEISIACTHMDRSYGYYFRIHRDGDKWLFDTECFTHGHETETVFENSEVSNENVSKLLDILERNGSIAYAENYKKPKASPFEIMDETTYSFCLAFSDGEQYNTLDSQSELEQFFYRLAERSNE